MTAIQAALLMCISTAISRIFLKKGFQYSSPETAMMYSLIFSFVTLTTFTLLIEDLSQINWPGVAFFALIGVFAPPVVRYLTYLGVSEVGPSRSEQIRSLTPLFAVVFAVTFLDEKLRISTVISLALILSGAILLISRKQKTVVTWSKWAFLYPLGAAILAGLAANMRKYGFELLTSPLLAGASTATSAIIVFPLFMKLQGKYDKIQLRTEGYHFFLLSGLFNSFSVVMNLLALREGEVSLVSPILASIPLFVIALSWIFLKKQEKITKELVLASLLIFSGVEIIILYGS